MKAPEPKQSKVEPVEIGSVIATRVYLRSPRETGRQLVWPPMSYSERSEASRTSPAVELENLNGLYVDDTDGEWYVFFEADCYSPPLYAVRANGWESAYECFIEEFATVISDPDLADYDDDCDHVAHTSRGPVDTESINGFEVTLARVDA